MRSAAIERDLVAAIDIDGDVRRDRSGPVMAIVAVPPHRRLRSRGTQLRLQCSLVTGEGGARADDAGMRAG